MKKRILIIHGWESNSREHWFLREKKRLEASGHEVVVPNMPNTLRPEKEEWVKVIEDFNPQDDSVLIGHSLGGTAILRYLEATNNKIPKSVLMATPIRKLRDSAYDFSPTYNFFEPGFDWEKIKQNCREFIVMNQTDDPWVPVQHGKDLARYLDGNLEIIEGNDHFDDLDFTLLERHILD